MNGRFIIVCMTKHWIKCEVVAMGIVGEEKEREKDSNAKERWEDWTNRGRVGGKEEGVGDGTSVMLLNWHYAKVDLLPAPLRVTL